jgi:hypothetical protein
MSKAIGTCSRCGGPVVVPTQMVHPVPCCQSCGATPRDAHGPVIQMEGGGARTGDPYDLSAGDKGFKGIRKSGVR